MAERIHGQRGTYTGFGSGLGKEKRIGRMERREDGVRCASAFSQTAISFRGYPPRHRYLSLTQSPPSLLVNKSKTLLAQESPGFHRSVWLLFPVWVPLIWVSVVVAFFVIRQSDGNVEGRVLSFPFPISRGPGTYSSVAPRASGMQIPVDSDANAAVDSIGPEMSRTRWS